MFVMLDKILLEMPSLALVNDGNEMQLQWKWKCIEIKWTSEREWMKLKEKH